MNARQNGRLSELVADLDWYALIVPPQKEFAAQEALNRFGVVTFCPYDVMFRHKSRIAKLKGLPKEERQFPIMPRYVFAGFTGRVPWGFLLHDDRFHLIKGVVGHNGVPMQLIGKGRKSIMPDFIRQFKNGLRRPNEERFMRTHHEYKVGDLATVVEGAFKDRVVEVESIEGGKAFFRLEVFNSQHRLALPLDHLEAA